MKVLLFFLAASAFAQTSVFPPSGVTSSTGLSDTVNIVRNNQTNAYTGGGLQNLGTSSLQLGGSLSLTGNLSAAAWTTNGLRIKGVPSTFTDTSSSGTVAAAYTDVLGGNTIAASSATTFTNYYTAYIKDPVAGTNVTMTNKYSLGVDSFKSAAITDSGLTPTRIPFAGTGGLLGDSANIIFSDANGLVVANASGSNSISAVRGNETGGGNNYGVMGSYSGSASNNGTGVYGENTQTTGTVGYALRGIINGSQATSYAGSFSNSSSSGTKYGVHGSASGTGTINYGGYFTASGGTTNYGLIVDAAKNGIGPLNTSPTVTLSIADLTATTGATRVAIGLGAADSASTVTFTNAGSATIAGTLGVSGTLTGAAYNCISCSAGLYTNTNTSIGYNFHDNNGLALSSFSDIRIATYNGSSYTTLLTITGNTATPVANFISAAAVTWNADTSLSRVAAGIIGAGTGAQGSVAGTFRGLYQSSDGTAGATVTTCAGFKNGLCISGT